MRTYLGLLTNAVRSALRSKHDLMLENLALRQQLAVLTRQRARTRTKPADRLFWSWLSRYWPGWRSTPVMVQPETIRWHRTAWRGYWTWKSRARHPGRPRISKELQGLIARIATENPRWGAVRIQGELLALGYEVSAETVRCYRRRALRRPPSQSWRTFLANHRPQLRAADFFTVQTLTFKTLYVFFFITHARRRIVVGRQNLMRPTDTHDANLLAPACCRLAGSASAAPACVPPESRAPMTDAAASRFGAGRTHQAPASDAVR